MNRAFALVLALLIPAGLAMGCGKATKASASETIKIGYVGPLTGDAQPWGEAQLNEIKLCVANVNAKGGILGRQIKLTYYDNRADNVESVNATKKLIQENKVCAILGPNASGAAIAMASVCDENKVPMIATNATNVSVTRTSDGKTRPYVFRACLTEPQYSDAVASYAYGKMGYKNAAILYEIGSDYSIGLKTAFEKRFSALGGKITTVEAYKTDDMDFRAQLSKIRRTNPDIIFLPALYKQIALIANQARDLGEDAVFFGCDSWFSKDILSLAAKAVEGSVFTAAMDVHNDALADIKAEYRKAYNEEIDTMGTTGYYGYDAFMLLKAAIEKAGSDDSTAIRDALQGIAGIKGCIGELALDAETHNPSRPLAIMIVKDGAFTTLETFTPAK